MAVITSPPISPSAISKPTTSSSDNVSPNAFSKLTLEITKVLGPSSGLTSDDVDASYLHKLMDDYISNESEWAQFAIDDRSRGYTRNLIDEGNGKSNLLVLVWTPGKGSPVHDHADAHCLMKVLRGSLVETRYAAPIASSTGEHTQGEKTPQPLQVIKESTYTRDQVAYMSDDLGLHRISNPSADEIAVSLHLYTPPNAAREGCNIFDPKTGKSSHITQSNYYSVYGVKT